MKAFMFVGVGFYNPENKNWNGVGLSVAREIPIPEGIQFPELPEELSKDKFEMTIVGMEAVQKPNEGMNPITGFIACKDREFADKMLKEIRDNIESGKLSITKGQNEPNPINDFIFQNGIKDFMSKN